MKIEVAYKVCGEELQNFIFEYGETTTLADLLNELGLNHSDILTDKENHLCHYTRGENVYLAVKYIVEDGIVKWIVPVEQCTIEEYLNQFNRPTFNRNNKVRATNKEMQMTQKSHPHRINNLACDIAEEFGIMDNWDNDKINRAQKILERKLSSWILTYQENLLKKSNDSD